MKTVTAWTIALLSGTICALSVQTAVGQQYREGRQSPAYQANPLEKLHQLRDRLQKTFSKSEQTLAVDLRGDKSLRWANDLLVQENNRARKLPTNGLRYPQAERIGVEGGQAQSVRATWQQPEPEYQSEDRYDRNGWREDGYRLDQPPTDGQSLPGLPQRYQSPTPRFPSQGSGDRSENPLPNNRLQQSNDYQNYGSSANPIFNNASSGNGPRFQHFTNRIPASERVIQLENELSAVYLREKSLKTDNEYLSSKLKQNEHLLSDIQSSIDEAIQQLTAAQKTNQDLRTTITKLEMENQEQEQTSSRLLDDIREHLNELLATEISGGG